MATRTKRLSADRLEYRDVAKAIDHSLLRPELDDDAVREGCGVAREYDVASVCVRPADVATARDLLAGSDVRVGTVIGFPHGAHATATKVAEAERAMADGAVELDMVLNIGALRSGRDDDVREDIAAVVRAAEGRAIVKVILENAYLDRRQKVRACKLAEAAGADFVKTSTGFAPSGATVEDLRLMRRTVSDRVQVKAAGGVRTLDALVEALNAGASRVGATATKAILDEYRARSSGDAEATAAGGLGGGY